MWMPFKYSKYQGEKAMEDNEWFGVKPENYIKLNSKNKTQENYTYLNEKCLTNNIGNYEIHRLNS